MKYYYVDSQRKPQGPVDREVLVQLYTSGIVTFETLVVEVGGQQWRPFKDLVEGEGARPAAGAPSPQGAVPPAPSSGASSPPVAPMSQPPQPSPAPAPNPAQFEPTEKATVPAGVSPGAIPTTPGSQSEAGGGGGSVWPMAAGMGCFFFLILGALGLWIAYTYIEPLIHGATQEVEKQAALFEKKIEEKQQQVSHKPKAKKNAQAEELQKKADQGDPEACYQLGLMHEHGRGVERDSMKARSLYRKAAQKGHALSQFKLGDIYLNGEGGIKSDPAKAAKWYLKAAGQGDVDAQFNYAYLLTQGKGVDQDYVAACEWFTKAAEQGDAEAQAQLGFIYFKGQGVDKDYARAAVWYEKAAGQGNEEAQNSLAFMYANGRGVAKNLHTALKWYRLASKQGNRMASENVALIEERLAKEEKLTAQEDALQATQEFPKSPPSALGSPTEEILPPPDEPDPLPPSGL